MKRSPSRAVVLFSLLLVCGCQQQSLDDPTLPRAYITGTITLDGKPLPKGVILLERTDHAVATQVSINSDGSFKAQTLDGLGLPLGEYRVAVSLRDINGADAASLSPSPITDGSSTGGLVVPVRYQMIKTSDLLIHVRAVDDSPVRIELVQ